MKTFLTTILTCFVFYHVTFATVRTVSNSPSGGAQYSSLQAAYDASSSGDTMLVEGTDIVYNLNCQVPWNKSITVIGIGFNPSKQSPKRTKFRETDCWGEFRIYPGGSGSRFYGIEFTPPVWTANQSLNNVVFEDCKFNTQFNFGCASTTNFAFRNCVFDGDNQNDLNIGGCGTAASGIVSNCVFDGHIEGNSSVISSVIVEHCLFLGTTVNAFNGFYNGQVRNCIFMNTPPIAPTGAYNCSFDNNLCRVAATFPPYPGNGNTGSNNIEQTSPMFVNYTNGTLYNATQDYHLQAGSPAIGTAADGTDIGVHGGFTGFSEQGEVLINPIIRALNILNTSVASNGILNVQIHATKPDNN